MYDPHKTLDWALALRRAGNREGLARELLQMLLDSLPQAALEVRQIIQGAKDLSPLSVVHKIHGASLCSGLPRLTSICRQIEVQLRGGLPGNLLMPEWFELLDEIDNTDKISRQWLSSSRETDLPTK